jgi:RNA polymerase sigma-70 factor (ECF subfamily)
MRTIATNPGLDLLKRRGRRATVDLDVVPEDVTSTTEDTHAAAVRHEALEQTVAAVLELPPRQRDVVILHDVLGWGTSDIADRLDTGVAGVYSAQQRARRTLRKHQIASAM